MYVCRRERADVYSTCGEPSVGDGEDRNKFHDAGENWQQACRLTEVIPRRDSRRGLSSSYEFTPICRQYHSGGDVDEWKGKWRGK